MAEFLLALCNFVLTLFWLAVGLVLLAVAWGLWVGSECWKTLKSAVGWPVRWLASWRMRF